MAASVRSTVKLRQTAAPAASGEWQPVLNDIFNKEVYPAIRAAQASLSVSTLFPPVFLTGASNALIADYEHMNVLVSDPMPTQLTLSASDSRAFPLGAIVLLGQDGPGQLELVPGSGVAIETRATLKLLGQYSRAWLVKKGDLLWELFGELEQIPIVAAQLIQDSFIGGNLSATGNNTNANVGQLAWNLVQDTQAGTFARIASDSEHPGVVRGSGHPTLGSRQSAYLGHAAVNGSVVRFDEVDYIEFVVRHIQNRFRFFVGDDAAAPAGGNNRVAIGGDKDITAFWALSNANAGVSSAFTTDIPITTNWITWRIQFVSDSELRFFADGNLIWTSTTNIPSFSAFMAPAIQVVTITPGPLQGIGDIDLFTIQMK